jgi:ribosomal protein S18 acetylase RimI-like enzyme
MPIIVEPLNEATYQDQQDLQKIYRDAPDWLFAPFSGDLQLIEGCLRDGSLIAGRFNDRLLGAARLQRHPGVWHLSQICVRKITRRRGVAERLVNEAQKMAAQSGAVLRLLAPAGHLEAQALAAKLKVALDEMPA